MGLIVEKYSSTSTFREEVEEAKLKLKNAKPEANSELIEKLRRKTFEERKPKFFLKPPPIEIHALADLHLEAQYKQGEAVVSPSTTMEPWDAAKAYVELKDLEVNKHPGSPIVLRSSSHSSLQSVNSPKNVRFAEIEADMFVYDKKTPTKEKR